MVRQVKYNHNVVVTGGNDGTKQVSQNAWNDGHNESGMFGWGTVSTLTVATGAITPVNSYHKIDGEGASADDLATITNTETAEFDELWLVSGAQTITLVNSGNIVTLSGENKILSALRPTKLIRVGTTWYEVAGDAVLQKNQFVGRQEFGKGADIASADAITIGVDGNVFDITGTTTINHFNNTGVQDGTIIALHFDGALTLTHNAGGLTGDEENILLAGDTNYTTSAGDILTFVLHEDGWQEVSRNTLGGTVTPSSTTTFTNKTMTDFSNTVHADTIHLQVRNESGGAITIGQAVYISGYSVGSDLPLVSLADADSSTTMPAIGLVADASIANNANGEVIVSGRLSGFDTSTFTAGDSAFISATAGALSTRPTGSTQQVQKLGTILRSHATLGVIDIRGAGRTNDVPNAFDINGRVEFAKGADIASADAITFGTDGNLFDITGVTTINHFNNTNMQDGTMVVLHFDGAVQLTHNAGALAGDEENILLNGNTNYTTSAGDVLTFILHENGWEEISRNSGTGSGSQTPWTSNIDADGFDLADLSNVEFRDTTGAPVGTTPAIWNDATGFKFNQPTGDNFEFQINGSTITTLDANRLLLTNRLNTDKGADVASATEITLGTDGNVFDITGVTTIEGIATANWSQGAIVTLQFDGALTLTHGAGTSPDLILAGATNASVSAGEVFQFFYNGTDWVEISRNAGDAGAGSQTPWTSNIDASDFSLNNLDKLEFNNNVDTPVIGQAEIYYNDTTTGMNFNAKTGDDFTFRVNGTIEYNFNATTFDFGGNTLTDILDITSITSLNGVAIGNYILSTDNISQLATATKAQYDANVSDGTFAFENDANIFTANQEIGLSNATATLIMDANHTTAADGNTIGQIDFFDTTTVAPAEQLFGQIRTVIQDPTNANYSAEMMFGVAENAGAIIDYIVINEADGLDVTFKKNVDLGGNTLTNLADITTITNLNGVAIGNYILSTDNISQLATATKAQYDANLSDGTFAYVNQANAFTLNQSINLPTSKAQLILNRQDTWTIADEGGQIQFTGDDDAGTPDLEYASIIGRRQDGTSTSKDGQLLFRVVSNNANSNALRIDGVGKTIDVESGWELDASVGTMKIPLSATPTMAVDGDFAIDTTVTDFSHGIMKYYDGEEMAVVALPIAQLTTPTGGHVVAYNATNDEFELVAQSGGSQSPWVSDIDADGFDLDDLSNISFRTTTGAPLGTTFSIWKDAGGMIFNVATATDFDWSINGTSEMLLNATSLDLQGNNLIDFVSLQATTANVTIDSGAGGWTYDVDTGDSHTWRVADTNEMVLNATTLDLQSNNLITTGNLTGVDVTLSGRLKTDKGADVASATEITLGADGNVFDITGVTTIEGIATASWQVGSIVTLQFDGALTLTHGAGTSPDLILAGATNASVSAGEVFQFFFNGTDWVEISRNAGDAGAGSQTPWTSDIDADGFSLFDVQDVRLNSDEAHQLDFERATAQADGYVIGEIRFRHDDTGAVLQDYARITGVMESDAGNTEDGSMHFYASTAGVHADEYFALNDPTGALGIDKVRFYKEILYSPATFFFDNTATTLQFDGDGNRRIFNNTTGFIFEVATGDNMDWQINNASQILLDANGINLSTRLKTDKGADVASATDITLGTDGNVFDITGITTIAGISATNWQAGSIITLQFDGALTLTHGAGTSPDLILAGATNATTSAGDVYQFFYNGTDWVEISRNSGAGGGSQTPWTSDIDADGFDLTDLSNIEFRTTTGAPAVGTQAIYADVDGIILNVATGDDYNFNINGVSELTLSASGITMPTGNTITLGAQDEVFYGLSTNWIRGDTGGIDVSVTTGDNIEFIVAGSLRATIDTTGIDLGSLDLSDFSNLISSTTGVTIDSSTGGWTYDVATGDSHIWRINDVTELSLDVNGLDLATRLQEAKGADVASATEISLGADGNVFDITGVTTIEGIATANWQSGSIVTLQFDGALTLTHGAGTSPDLILAGATNASVSAGEVFQFFFNGTDWVEISRNAGDAGGGSQTPWTSDIDADGFDLTDLGHIDFRQLTVGQPAGTVPAIYYDNSASGAMNYNVPTGTEHSFKVNGTEKVEIDGGGIRMATATDIIMPNGGDIFWDAVGDRRIFNDTTGFIFEVQTGDNFNWQINSVQELLLDVNGLKYATREQLAKGADVASATDITLGTDGNVFDITGVTTIAGIATANWQAGSIVTLQFDGALQLTHGAGTSPDLLLANATNYTTSAGDVLQFFYNGTDWVEIARNAGEGGGGSQTPWTSDIDADGFDLTDLSNIEFRTTTGAPAGTVQAIYADAGGINFNVPTGQEFGFFVNGVEQLSIDVNEMNFNSNNVLGISALTTTGTVHLASGQEIRWGAITDRRIFNNTTGFIFEVSTGDNFVWEIQNTAELTLNATQLDLADGKEILNAGHITTENNNTNYIWEFLNQNSGAGAVIGSIRWSQETGSDIHAQITGEVETAGVSHNGSIHLWAGINGTITDMYNINNGNNKDHQWFDETGTLKMTLSNASLAMGTTPITFGSDPADAGAIRLSNADLIAWEASPAGTDGTLTFDSNEWFTFNSALGVNGANESGKTLTVTIPDDTVSEGIIMKNTDGSLIFINGNGATDNFESTIRGTSASVSSNSGIVIDGVIPVASDSGTTPVVRFRAFQDDSTVIDTRPLFIFENLTTKLLSIEQDGSVDRNVQTSTPSDPATDFTREYSRDVDANNEGKFIKMKVAGSVQEVRIA